MLAFILSNLVGLVRGILIYRAFGTSADLDSFNAANRVTEVLYNLMAGGALGSAFIPVFTGFLTRKDTSNAWKLASGVINLLISALAVVCLIAILLAPQIVRHGLFILNPAASLGQLDLTTLLLRILLPTILIFGVSGLMMGMLNSFQQFWIPAITPAMYSLGMIIGVTVFPPDWGIQRLAWGALLGSGLHLLIQLPSILKLKFSYQPRFFWHLPEVREVIRLFIPRIFGVAVVQLNFIVNTIIALSQPEGSASALTLAFSLMLMPQMAIAQSIAIASLPSFSAQAAQGKLAEMRSSLAATLRGVLLLSLPASLGLILLRQPLIRLLYEGGGVFDSHSTAMVSWALLFYAAGLVGHSVVEIISRAFYALHDTRTPVMVGAAAMGLNLIFSFGFSTLFKNLGLMPHGGLALANSLATFLEMIALLIVMRKKLGSLEGGIILEVVVKAAFATLIMAAILPGWSALSTSMPDWIVLFGGLLLGLLAYGVVIHILKVREFQRVITIISRKIRRSDPAS